MSKSKPQIAFDLENTRTKSIWKRTWLKICKISPHKINEKYQENV